MSTDEDSAQHILILKKYKVLHLELKIKINNCRNKGIWLKTDYMKKLGA